MNQCNQSPLKAQEALKTVKILQKIKIYFVAE